MKTFLLHRLAPALIPFIMGHTLAFKFEDHSFPFRVSSYLYFVLLPSVIGFAIVFIASGIQDALLRRRALYATCSGFALFMMQYLVFLTGIEGTIYVIQPYWGLGIIFVVLMWILAWQLGGIRHLVIRLLLLAASLYVARTAFIYAAIYFLGLQ